MAYLVDPAILEEIIEHTALPSQLPATSLSTELVQLSEVPAPGITALPLSLSKEAKAAADATKKDNAQRQAEFLGSIMKAKPTSSSVAAQKVRETNLRKHAEVLQSVAKTVPAAAAAAKVPVAPVSAALSAASAAPAVPAAALNA